MTVEFEQHADLEDYIPGTGYVGEIKYTAPYALYVNYDTTYTSGKKPPFQPLFEWVERNWGEIDSETKQEVEEAHGGDMTTDELKKAVTWYIINAIYKHGIEGTHFVERSIDHGKSKKDNVIAAHAGKENGIEAIVRNITEIMFEFSQGTIERESKDTGELKDSGEWEVREEDP